MNMLLGITFIVLGLCGIQSLHIAPDIIIRQCFEQEAPDVNLLRQLKDGETVEDTKVKCFARCILLKIGVFTPESELDVEHLVKQATDGNHSSAYVEKIRKKANVCKKITGTDSCDKAFNVVNCLEISN